MFSLTEYEDSNKNTIHLIKDWKDLVNQVSVVFGLNNRDNFQCVRAMSGQQLFVPTLICMV